MSSDRIFIYSVVFECTGNPTRGQILYFPQ